jgi:N-acetylglucosamine-6-sulfatase
VIDIKASVDSARIGGSVDLGRCSPGADPLAWPVEALERRQSLPLRGMQPMPCRARLLLALTLALAPPGLARPASAEEPSRPSKRPNIVLILTDDHRYDAAGFMGHPYLETPNIDRMSRDGVVFANAFVTTSLCSPSRASILTGCHAHRHGVIDNYTPVPPTLRSFPESLRKAGYRTAFIGKWHMGETDAPQRGFDRWVSFKGQGSYWADGRGTNRVVPQTSGDGFNVDGRRVPQRGYITDELTDYALDWLATLPEEAPFFLYLAHKAVHSDFVPADRHRGRYADRSIPLPATFADTPANYADKPMWLKNQRNSRHGVDDAFNLGSFDLQGYHRRYCETLLAVDESLGRVFQHLERRGALRNTLIVYMGDNGYQFGEHGLIDKRTAYEVSMRIPLLAHWPEGFPAGRRVEPMVANIDVAPTLLAVAGAEPLEGIDGRDFSPLARGEAVPWREALLYEYFWEWNYPYTPTLHAVRTERYKYIRAHGLWDLDELYDLRSDPAEAVNLIGRPEHRATIRELDDRLFTLLEQTGGLQMPLRRGRDASFPLRRRDGAEQGTFPDALFRPARTP